VVVDRGECACACSQANPAVARNSVVAQGGQDAYPVALVVHLVSMSSSGGNPNGFCAHNSSGGGLDRPLSVC